MRTLSIAFILTLCAFTNIEAQTPKRSEVTGYVYHRERIALPANAIVHVQLLDVTRPNAPALLITEKKMTANGQQVPFFFDLRYDPKKIDSKRAYAVYATISVEGQVWFANGTDHRVLTQGKPNSVDILVERVTRFGGYGRAEGNLRTSDSICSFVVYYDGKQPAYLMEKSDMSDGSTALNEYVFNAGVMTYYHQTLTLPAGGETGKQESVVRMLFDKKGTLIFGQKMVNGQFASLASTEPQAVRAHLRELLKTVKPPPVPVEVVKVMKK